MNSVWWAVNGNFSPMPCLPSKLSIFPEVPAKYCGRPSWDCAYALKVISHESSEIQYLMEWIFCLIPWHLLVALIPQDTNWGSQPSCHVKHLTTLQVQVTFLWNVTQCFLNLLLYILYIIVLVFSIIALDIDH